MDVFRLAPAVLCLLAAILAAALGGFLGVALACWGSCEPATVATLPALFAAPGVFFAICYFVFLRVLRGRVAYRRAHGVWATIGTMILAAAAALTMNDVIAGYWGRPQEAALLLMGIAVLSCHGMTMRGLWLKTREAV
ncbi:hypothetical protein C8N43_3605 [Litoreibacter ponti]|uniref:Uncharacterized protein n=1 Tax=Litoreibacter ponti TaxID=1510457 RepID=A0A2T6BFF2_9RHOB|nr:hypothetical protein [Litoreibacter ponti]PTX54784.1 hypothetical protein C8N43_3605 [Litoreibacter ponti]